LKFCCHCKFDLHFLVRKQQLSYVLHSFILSLSLSLSLISFNGRNKLQCSLNLEPSQPARSHGYIITIIITTLPLPHNKYQLLTGVVIVLFFMLILFPQGISPFSPFLPHPNCIYISRSDSLFNYIILNQRTSHPYWFVIKGGCLQKLYYSNVSPRHNIFLLLAKVEIFLKHISGCFWSQADYHYLLKRSHNSN
jgi:hypothetical protein